MKTRCDWGPSGQEDGSRGLTHGSGGGVLKREGAVISGVEWVVFVMNMGGHGRGLGRAQQMTQPG